MIRKIVKDILFLGQKSDEADESDRPIIEDLKCRAGHPARNRSSERVSYAINRIPCSAKPLECAPRYGCRPLHSSQIEAVHTF